MKEKIWRIIYIFKSVQQSYFPSKKQLIPTDINFSKKIKKRILIIVHEDFFTHKGGVESYVLNLYKEFFKKKDFDFFYLCRVNLKERKIGDLWKDKEKNNVYYLNLKDGNVYTLLDFRFDSLFGKFVADLNPDIVHFQHYIHFSLTWFEVIKKILPNTKIVLTLHEFLGICPNSGQMIKTKWQNFKLCNDSIVENCKKCFPYLPKNVFKKRNNSVKKYFKYVDLITAPSKFVLERYKNFGLKNKMIYSENGQEIFKILPKIKSEKLRLLYLGQINKFKGLDVLLEAMNKICNENVSLSIYGKFQDDEKYNQKILGMIKNLSNVNFYGAYNRNQLPEIFSKHDLLVVPSIWWENSPMVIQESFMAKTPVLCSNIGGMKEKIIDGKNGWYFKVGNSMDLAKKITNISSNKNMLEKISVNIKFVKSVKENSVELIAVYKSI